MYDEISEILAYSDTGYSFDEEIHNIVVVESSDTEPVSLPNGLGFLEQN
jgi:hypothetical protein